MFSLVRIHITFSLCLVLFYKMLVWHLPLVFFLFNFCILFARFLLRSVFLVQLVTVVMDFLD